MFVYCKIIIVVNGKRNGCGSLKCTGRPRHHHLGSVFGSSNRWSREWYVGVYSELIFIRARADVRDSHVNWCDRTQKLVNTAAKLSAFRIVCLKYSSHIIDRGM